MFLRKNKQKTYKELPKDYEKPTLSMEYMTQNC